MDTLFWQGHPWDSEQKTPGIPAFQFAWDSEQQAPGIPAFLFGVSAGM